MKRYLLAVVLLLTSCGLPPESNIKVIVGAQLPSKNLDYSVIIVEGKLIREVGAQSDIPVPKGVDITSGMGKVLEPPPGGSIEPGQPATFSLRNAQTTAIDARMVDGNWK